MSSGTSATPDMAAVQAIIGAFTASIRTVLLFTVEAAIFLGMTLPILVALLYFSTAHSRKTWMWNVVVLDVLLCMGLGAWTLQQMVGRTFAVDEWMDDSRKFVDLVYAQPLLARAVHLKYTRLHLLHRDCILARRPAPRRADYDCLPLSLDAAPNVDDHNRDRSRTRGRARSGQHPFRS
jgi:hypothetical protein